MRDTLQQRFEDKIIPEPNSGCWIWVGSLNPQTGYGQISSGERPETAHRVSWRLNRGPIPEGMHVLHHCDQRWCCNPDHLFLGGNDDNIYDAVFKGRMRGNGGLNGENLRGVRCYQAKLDDTAVLEILASAEPERALASRFGVASSVVHEIKHRKIWRHVDGPVHIGHIGRKTARGIHEPR